MVVGSVAAVEQDGVDAIAGTGFDADTDAAPESAESFIGTEPVRPYELKLMHISIKNVY